MAKITSTHLPLPESPVEFERAILEMARISLPSSDLARFGRSGQAQHGIDHEGHVANDPNRPVVLQSKCRNPGVSENPSDIRNHVEACVDENIEFVLFIYVTSAARDAGMQKAARETTKWLRDEKGIPAIVRVWDWGYIVDEASSNPNIRKIFDPTFVSRDDQLAGRLDSLSDDNANAANTARQRHEESLNALRDNSSLVKQIAEETRAGGKYSEIIEFLTELNKTDPNKSEAKAIELLTKPDITNEERSRLLGSRGNACLQRGEDSNAAAFFVAAYELAPDRPGAVANFAFALGDTGRLEELRTLAETAIPKFPDTPILAIRCAFYLKDFSVIPEVIANEPLVAVARLEIAHDECSAREHREAAEAALATHPDHKLLKSLVGAAILNDLAQARPLHLGSFWTGAEKASIEQAATLLSEVWDDTVRIGGFQPKRSKADPFNLIVALRLLGRAGEAVTVIRTMMELGESSPESGYVFASVLSEAGLDDEAEAIIAKLPETIDTLRFKVARLQAQKKWRELADQLDAGRDLYEDRDRAQMEAIQIIATIEAGPVKDRATMIDDALSNTPDDPLAISLYYQLAQLYGRENKAQELLDKSTALLIDGVGNDDGRRTIAEHLLDENKIDDVFNLLEGHVPTDAASPALLILLRAGAHETPPRARGPALFDSLPDNLQDDPQIRYLRGVLEYNHGRPDQAQSIWSRLNRQEPNLRYIALLCDCASMRNDMRGIHQLLARNDLLDLDGPALSKMRISAHAMRSGLSELALKLGLAAVREGYHSPQITANYTTLILCHEIPTIPVQVVGDGVFVRLTSDGSEPISGLIGCDDAPWGDKLSTERPVLRNAIGRGVGEAFAIKGGLGREKIWQIETIQPEWLRAMQFLMREHESHFGEQALMANMHVGAEPDFGPLLDDIRAHGQELDRLCELAKTGSVPMRAIAQNRNGGAVGLAQIMRIRGVDIPVCGGQPEVAVEAYTYATEIIDAGEGITLDPFTAITAAEIGMLDVLKSLFGTLFVPNDDLSDFDCYLKTELQYPRESMRMDSHNGQVVRTDVSVEEQQTTLEDTQRVFDEVRALCSMETVIFPDELSEGENQIRLLVPETITPILLAANRSTALMSDDMALRRLAAQERGIKGVWLQICLEVARDRNLLTTEKYLNCLACLIGRRHQFVFLTTSDLIKAHNLPSSARSDIIFAVLVSRLSDQDISHSSRVDVATGVLNSILNRPGMSASDMHRCGEVLVATFSAFDRGALVSHIQNMQGHLRGNAKKYFDDWVAGHFLMRT